jgi:hypothetical protein
MDDSALLPAHDGDILPPESLDMAPIGAAPRQIRRWFDDAVDAR